MREIKFRAWDKKSKKMFDVAELHSGGTIVLFDKEEGYLGRGCGFCSEDEEWLYQSNFELMQYTGLKDKNGKEIYEGDILKWDAPKDDGTFVITAVSFYEGAFVDDEDGDPISSWDIAKEVIGNIYENGDLLK